MVILSDNEIDNICLQIVSKIDEIYPYYSPHIHLLYDYGCRIGEVFEYRFTFDPETNLVHIIAQKNNNVRELTAVNFETNNWVELLLMNQDNYWLNVRNLQRIIGKVHPIRNLKCGEKRIGAHLFRHNWIRKMKNAGKQFTEIDRMLGYTTQSVQDTYLAAVIYY